MVLRELALEGLAVGGALTARSTAPPIHARIMQAKRSAACGASAAWDTTNRTLGARSALRAWRLLSIAHPQRSSIKPVNCQAVPHSASARSRCRGDCRSQRGERAAPKVTTFKPAAFRKRRVRSALLLHRRRNCVSMPALGEGGAAEEAPWSSEPRAPGNTLRPDC